MTASENIAEIAATSAFSQLLARLQHVIPGLRGIDAGFLVLGSVIEKHLRISNIRQADIGSRIVGIAADG